MKTKGSNKIYLFKEQEMQKIVYTESTACTKKPWPAQNSQGIFGKNSTKQQG